MEASATCASISDIAEELFDQIIAPDPKETAGIGGDNMTCMIVEFKW